MSTKKKKEAQDPCFNFLIDQSFQGINILFVFEFSQIASYKVIFFQL